MATPLLIRRCLQLVAAGAAGAAGAAVVLGLFVASMLQSTALNHCAQRTFSVAASARASVGAVVFAKALRLTPATRQKTGAGRVLQLVSKDCDTVAQFFVFIHNLWSAPLTAVLTCGMLYRLLGPAVLAGVALTAVAIPLEMKLASLQKKVQAAAAKHSDTRLQLLVNTVAGMRLVKLAFGGHFRAAIEGARAQELAAFLRSSAIRAATVFFMSCTPILVTVSTLVCYHKLGHPVTPDVIFPALVLFNALGHPFKIFPKVSVTATSP